MSSPRQNRRDRCAAATQPPGGGCAAPRRRGTVSSAGRSGARSAARRGAVRPTIEGGAGMPERDGYLPGVPCWVETTQPDPDAAAAFYGGLFGWEDRKSTRLNSSHSQISYAVFCLKKKKLIC